MRIIRDVWNAPEAARGAVVAIGNFDGLHLGHRAVIARCGDIARKEKRPCAVLTFEPHPRRFFQPDSPPLRLMSFTEKAEALTGMGVDILYVARFNAALSGLAAQEFIDRILVRGLGVSQVVTGEDFVFGKGRGGSRELLMRAAAEKKFGYGFVSMENSPPLEGGVRGGVGENTPGPPIPLRQEASPFAQGLRGTRSGDAAQPFLSSTFAKASADRRGEGLKISSSYVRALLSEGKPEEAEKLLGHPYAISGRVIHGDARGRTLGYPTANIRPVNRFLPKFGIYAVHARWKNKCLKGVANLGIRPMFKTSAPLLEAHLFDFDESLYGDRISVEFIRYLRPERNFDSESALTAQMKKDGEMAHDALRNYG